MNDLDFSATHVDVGLAVIDSFTVQDVQEHPCIILRNIAAATCSTFQYKLRVHAGQIVTYSRIVDLVAVLAARCAPPRIKRYMTD